MSRPFHIILAAETISALGSQITLVALPLTAVLLLHATPFQMGLLSGIGALPGVLFGAFAGVVIEGLPKRGVLIVANLISAVLLASIPISHALKCLSIGLLIAVNFAAVGIGSAESIALMTYLPSMVDGEKLAAANGRFSALRSTAQIAGPAAAGLLIAVSSAPTAICFDAASFLVAVVLILGLPASSPPTKTVTSLDSVLQQLKAGIQFVFKTNDIRRLIAIAVVLNFFGSGFAALQALFIVQHLGLPPSWYGEALAAGGIGAIIGASLSGRIARRLSIFTILNIVVALAVVADGWICSLRGSPAIIASQFTICLAISGFGSAIVGVAFTTFLQTKTPPEKLARVIGVLVTTMGASVPLGAFVSGILGGAIGVRHTMIAATLGYGGLLLAMLPIHRRH